MFQAGKYNPASKAHHFLIFFGGNCLMKFLGRVWIHQKKTASFVLMEVGTISCPQSSLYFISL